MTKKAPTLQFRREDIPDLSTGERTDKLLRGLNQFGSSAEGLLNHGLTFADNFKAFTKTITVKGGSAAVAAATTSTAWHDVGDDGGATSFANSWVNYGAPYPNTRYKIVSGIVYVQFAVKLGTTGTAVFTLPAGYRPSATIGGTWCYEANGDLLINMTVSSAGVVAIVGSAGNALSFGSFSFPADDYTEPTGTDAVSPFPTSFKNELDVAPRHVWMTRLVDVSGGTEVPTAPGGVAWAVSRDQIVISDLGGVSPGSTYKATLLIVGE